eukprot:TRINITY_DN4149_c0_g1_i2.p2 TRINITY_DN4149_c0_g1~~TRINITY_DN4149_c0_g1_i2.p2  ORF type:complete len:115 (-),score=16.21 TRINITY_DN4149_c0_g1_i2:219-563(-)
MRSLEALRAANTFSSWHRSSVLVLPRLKCIPILLRQVKAPLNSLRGDRRFLTKWLCEALNQPQSPLGALVLRLSQLMLEPLWAQCVDISNVRIDFQLFSGNITSGIVGRGPRLR